MAVNLKKKKIIYNVSLSGRARRWSPLRSLCLNIINNVLLIRESKEMESPEIPIPKYYYIVFLSGRAKK